MNPNHTHTWDNAYLDHQNIKWHMVMIRLKFLNLKRKIEFFYIHELNLKFYTSDFSGKNNMESRLMNVLKIIFHKFEF